MCVWRVVLYRLSTNSSSTSLYSEWTCLYGKERLSLKIVRVLILSYGLAAVRNTRDVKDLQIGDMVKTVMVLGSALRSSKHVPVLFIQARDNFVFYIFLSVYLRIILDGNQLDAQFFSIICVFESSIDNKIIEQVNSFNYLGNTYDIL